ncbi:MAG TPA: hypothetical protein VGE52_03855, partial [Pirellulales bacterium]
MTTWIAEIIDEAGGRHLSPFEQRIVRREAKRLRAAYEASRELERAESTILESVGAGLRSRHAGVLPWFDSNCADGALDLALALRVVAQAMLADEPRWLDDRLLDFCRAVLGTLGVARDAAADCYSELLAAVQREVSEPTFALARPYLERLRLGMTDAPEGEVRRTAAAELRRAGDVIVDYAIAEQRAASADFESMRVDHEELLRCELQLFVSALATAVELDDVELLRRRATLPLV